VFGKKDRKLLKKIIRKREKKSLVGHILLIKINIFFVTEFYSTSGIPLRNFLPFIL
jgi:hypothetical protein